jgi:hypothetical protein
MATNPTSAAKQQSLEQVIIKNYDLFKTQAAKLNNAAIDKFLEDEADRIMVAPASTKTDFTCCHPGGLVEHSLRVLQNMAKLRNAYGLQDTVSANDLILAALFHDIGKIGTDTKSYYVDNDSQWHRDKLGILYNVADRFQHVPPTQISLWWLSSKLNVELDIDVWYAVSTINNTNKRDDQVTQGEPWLAVILQQAVKAACIQGKGKTQVQPIQ